MRRRLRKKLHKQEFTQHGFVVQYGLIQGLATETADGVLDRFILEAVEESGLQCGGGGGPTEWEFFLCGIARRSATEADRERVARWLQTQPEVASSRVCPLEDAWYGGDDAQTIA